MPAGSPEGGQFTDAEGGDISGAGAGSEVSSAARESRLERYRAFKDDTSIKDQDFIVASQQKITDSDELAALDDYSKDGFKTINPAARGDEASQGAIEQAELLEGALSRTEAPVDMVVHRGVNMAHWGIDPDDPNLPDVTDRDAYAQFMVNHIDNNLKGIEYMDDSFLSTSMSRSTALEFAENKSNGAMVEIRVPEGTNGASVNFQLGGDNTFADEREFLLQKGLRYNIAGSSRRIMGPGVVPILIVEVVPEGE